MEKQDSKSRLRTDTDRSSFVMHALSSFFDILESVSLVLLIYILNSNNLFSGHSSCKSVLLQALCKSQSKLLALASWLHSHSLITNWRILWTTWIFFQKVTKIIRICPARTFFSSCHSDCLYFLQSFLPETRKTKICNYLTNLEESKFKADVFLRVHSLLMVQYGRDQSHKVLHCINQLIGYQMVLSLCE